MSRLQAFLLAACLVGSAFAESLTLAMSHLRNKDDGFDPKEPPTHTTNVNVGVYLEHLLDVSIEEHTFDMDFFFTLEWMDARNYSLLFSDPDLVESEPDSCVEQRNVMKKNRESRKMLSLPGGGDEDNDGVLPRKLAEDDEQLIDPQVGEIVKFFNEFVGEGGTTYTATIMSIYEEDGKMMYEIEYVDESTHAVTRITTIDKLSAMPQPARKFVEFGHDELKLIWKPDVHITNLHLDMNTHEEVNYLPSPARSTALRNFYSMHAECGVVPLRMHVPLKVPGGGSEARGNPLRKPKWRIPCTRLRSTGPIPHA